jgi:hypothetical protein
MRKQKREKDNKDMSKYLRKANIVIGGDEAKCDR